MVPLKRFMEPDLRLSRSCKMSPDVFFLAIASIGEHLRMPQNIHEVENAIYVAPTHGSGGQVERLVEKAIDSPRCVKNRSKKTTSISDLYRLNHPYAP